LPTLEKLEIGFGQPLGEEIRLGERLPRYLDGVAQPPLEAQHVRPVDLLYGSFHRILFLLVEVSC
jgi:hypothetical protein